MSNALENGNFRFSLRSALFALSTCAVAFALIAQSDSTPLKVLAGSVVAFWVAFLTLGVGDTLAGTHHSFVQSAGAVVMIFGFMMALLAITMGIGAAFAFLVVLLNYGYS